MAEKKNRVGRFIDLKYQQNPLIRAMHKIVSRFITEYLPTSTKILLPGILKAWVVMIT